MRLLECKYDKSILTIKYEELIHQAKQKDLTRKYNGLISSLEKKRLKTGSHIKIINYKKYNEAIKKYSKKRIKRESNYSVYNIMHRNLYSYYVYCVIQYFI